MAKLSGNYIELVVRILRQRRIDMKVFQGIVMITSTFRRLKLRTIPEDSRYE
jgi:hypothetical protein